MERRNFIRTLGTLGVAGGLAGCSQQPGQKAPDPLGLGKGGKDTAGGDGGDGTDSGDGSGGGGGGGGGGGSSVDESVVKDYLSDANTYDGIKDKTGNDEVTVEVGAGQNGYAFSPSAIRIDPGTTVVWKWTGNGGQHDVVHEEEEFSSDLLMEEGATFEHTFEEAGTYRYYCTPHKGLGMKGGVVVGSGGGGGGSGSGGGGGGGGSSEVESYLSDANNFDGIEDKTGSSEVTVSVGAGQNGYAYGPAAIRVDSGTTVVWEWTGNGGQHDVVHEGEEFSSELLMEEGATFEHTFESSGAYKYYCTPHKGLGMKGGVIVE